MKKSKKTDDIGDNKEMTIAPPGFRVDFAFGPGDYLRVKKTGYYGTVIKQSVIGTHGRMYTIDNGITAREYPEEALQIHYPYRTPGPFPFFPKPGEKE